jgi:hypothetical protein
LRSLVTGHVAVALESVLESDSWQQQSGGLNASLLGGLMELQRNKKQNMYRCLFERCGYQTRKRGTTIEHIRSTHFGNRPFICSVWYVLIKVKVE